MGKDFTKLLQTFQEGLSTKADVRVNFMLSIIVKT